MVGNVGELRVRSFLYQVVGVCLSSMVLGFESVSVLSCVEHREIRVSSE